MPIPARPPRPSRPWIRLSPPGGVERVKLLCLPYSGGNSQAYLPLAGMLPVNLGLYALELPGRGRRFHEPRLESVTAMVKEAADALERELGDAVYLLFGYSLGGLLAFELAREMRRRGLPLPRHLFVAAVCAPQIKPREKPFSDLPHDDFLTKIRELGGTPEELLVNPEILELLMPVLRSDFKAYETYTWREGQPLPCPITALGGTRDKLVEKEDLDGWSVHAGAGFGLHLFEGDHFFINTHFKDVCAIINRALSPQRPW